MKKAMKESSLREQFRKVTKECNLGEHSKEQSTKGNLRKLSSGKANSKSNPGGQSRRAFQESLPRKNARVQFN